MEGNWSTNSRQTVSKKSVLTYCNDKRVRKLPGHNSHDVLARGHEDVGAKRW